MFWLRPGKILLPEVTFNFIFIFILCKECNQGKAVYYKFTEHFIFTSLHLFMGDAVA